MLMPNRPKGKGVRAKYVPLLPQAVEAFKRFDAVGLWGLPHFSASSAWKSWTCAVENTRAALAREAAQTGDTQPLDDFNRDVPPKCHPYDLRHSFLTDAYEQTGDIRAVAGLGHHADIKTTERYTTGGVAKRETIAVDKMRDAWKDLPPVPPPAPRVPRPRGKLHLVPPRS
jgi:integrase